MPEQRTMTEGSPSRAMRPGRGTLPRTSLPRALAVALFHLAGASGLTALIGAALRLAGLVDDRLPFGSAILNITGTLGWATVCWTTGSAAVGLRLLRVVGATVVRIATAAAAAFAVLAVLSAIPLPALQTVIAALVGILVLVGAGTAIVGVILFLIRDVYWKLGEARLAPWKEPAGGWWDTSALDEDGEDEYGSMREGHPYDEVAILMERIGSIYGNHEK